MHVRLTQIDGKLPNLALMKLAHWHSARGDQLHFTKHIERDRREPNYGAVYGWTIFSFSAERVAAFRAQWPNAVVGGTHDIVDSRTHHPPSAQWRIEICPREAELSAA